MDKKRTYNYANTIAKDTLREYVKENEVVFQAFGALVEVANEAEIM
ncbi:MAG: hypothetical protein MJZ60_11195 [Bacteroidaceae bacterium]|nr:hypothetical protein [Bacteroidaceae bacterium]